MRRRDREITGVEDKLAVVDSCKFCRLALVDENRPYIVPLNYGYSFDNGVLTLFFHGAKEGRKLDVIRGNNSACFEIDCDTGLIEAQTPCGCGFAFKSVVGFGEITILEDLEEKAEALNYIMRHQTGRPANYDFTGARLGAVAVFKMTVREFTGKQINQRS
ncbi:MAG: pyridoxamine 5'-phosphate oxidase family protein [Spirochaetaceae bacterium]|jgi:nitroimidazol reductase NimA-like FMN-containing flavoprotein (pyridoxamine 5'-phosphate oxidase superfamily)|nr:pyridoxamine 5'-phosphate oxidase family protein [Spirochaetaceae bacterium]